MTLDEDLPGILADKNWLDKVTAETITSILYDPMLQGWTISRGHYTAFISDWQLRTIEYQRGFRDAVETLAWVMQEVVGPHAMRDIPSRLEYLTDEELLVEPVIVREKYRDLWNK